MNRCDHRSLLGALVALLGCGLVACGQGLGTRPREVPLAPPEATPGVAPIEVQGRLIGLQGYGLSNLEVHVESSASPMFGSLGGLDSGLDHQTTTDAGGYFQIAVPSTTTMLRVSVTLEGRRYFPWVPTFLERSGRNLGGLTVPARQEISGQVLDPQGVGRAGVTVRLGEGHRLATLVPPGFLIHECDDFLWLTEALEAERELAPLGVLTATTDEDGRFQFHAPFTDPWLSFLDHEGNPHAEACSAFNSWQDIPLTPHEMWTDQGAVLQENGKPAREVAVRATVTSCFGDYQILREQRTDAEGVASFSTERPRKVSALEYWDGPSWAWRQQKNAPWLLRTSFFGESLSQAFQLGKARNLSLRVEQEDGSAIDNAEVTWVQMPLFDPRIENQDLKLPPFAADGAGNYVAKGVPAGAVTAWVQAPGMMPTMVFWDPYPTDEWQQDWSKPQTVQLHRATTPTFHVVAGADQQPVAGAIIQFSPWVQWSNHEPICEEHEHPYFGNRGVTDAEGHWQAGPQCHRGAWISVVYGASSAEFAWDGSGGEVLLELGELATVSGTVLQQGIPAAELMLDFTPIDQDKLQVRIRADSQGHFQLPILAGEYTLEHGEFGRALWTSEGEWVETIALKAGEALDMLLLTEQP